MSELLLQIAREHTLEGEICKKGNIFRALLRLGQFCKDQEAPVPPSLSKSDTLDSDSQRIQITLCDGTPLHDTHRSEMFISQIDPRCNNTRREDPFRYGKGDFGLDFS